MSLKADMVNVDLLNILLNGNVLNSQKDVCLNVYKRSKLFPFQISVSGLPSFPAFQHDIM